MKSREIVSLEGRFGVGFWGVIGDSAGLLGFVLILDIGQWRIL